MKNSAHWLILMIASAFIIAGCDEPTEQDERIAPFVEAKFVNVDSLLKVDLAIDDLGLIIDEINTRIAEIDALSNRQDFQDEKDSLNVEKSTLDKEISAWNSVKTGINNGLLNVATISGDGAIEVIVNGSDSTNSYQLPLNPNTSSCRIFTIINNRKDTIDFTYKLEEKYIEYQLRAVASELDVPSFSFDSVKIEFRDTLSISNDAKITLYF